MESEPTYWKELIQKRISRRRLLQGAALAGAAAGAGLAPVQFVIQPADAAPSRLPFKPIEPTRADDLVVPRGFRYDVIARWGDRIDSNDTFGYNCDYTAFYPLRRRGNAGGKDGILAVNHEYVEPRVVGGNAATPKSAAQVAVEQYNVGMSFIHIRQRGNGPWRLVQDDDVARRITGLTFPITLTGPAAGSPSVGGRTTVAGSMGNCSGCHTPWDTVLSCEENYQDYYGENSLVSDGAGGVQEELRPERRLVGNRWHDVVPFDGTTPFGPAGNIVVRPEHYGYVMEVDPYNPNEAPRKHTSLGRFRHENVAINARPSQKVVAYMGDDRRGGHVYKFVSDGTYVPGTAGREGNKRLLETGTLYVAQFSSTGPADSADDQGTGTWIPINNAIGQTDPITGIPFTAASVLVHTFDAAKAVNGTPTDRPEDIEIHPVDRSVFIAFTNNDNRGITHGYVVRLVEGGNNPESLTFTWDVFAFGGPDADNNEEPSNGTGFSAPDNMVFDARANLWVVTDISSSRIRPDAPNPAFAPFGNNGVFFCPTSGPNAGKCFQFASAPVESEATGPTWSPDQRTLFLAIQHPGEDSIENERPLSSHWPDGGNAVPKPSVVAIRGFRRGR